jgi:hypothetical protein
MSSLAFKEMRIASTQENIAQDNLPPFSVWITKIPWKQFLPVLPPIS